MGERCDTCNRFHPYDEGCDDHEGGCGWCPQWDHVRADETLAGPDDTPCEHYRPKEKP